MIRPILASLSLVILLMMGSLALAESTQGNQTPQTEEASIPLPVKAAQVASESTPVIQKVAVSVIVLVSLFAGIFWLLKKYKFKNHKQAQYQIKILSQHHLSPKKSFAVISVSGEAMLIGITDHHISHLRTLSLIDDELEQSEAPKSFSQALKMNSAGKTESASETKPETDSFSFQFIQDTVGSKMRNMKMKDLG